MKNFKMGLFFGVFGAIIASSAFAENRDVLDASPYDQKEMKAAVGKDSQGFDTRICNGDKQLQVIKPSVDNKIFKGHLFRGSDLI